MLELEGAKVILAYSLHKRWNWGSERKTDSYHSFISSFILQTFLECQPGVKSHSKQSRAFHKLKSLAQEMDMNRTNSYTVWLMLYGRDWQRFSVQGCIINILISVGYIVSVATPKLHCCGTKADINKIQIIKMSVFQ